MVDLVEFSHASDRVRTCSRELTLQLPPQYTIISVDDHFIEPPTCSTTACRASRTPPKVVRRDGADWWTFETSRSAARCRRCRPGSRGTGTRPRHLRGAPTRDRPADRVRDMDQRGHGITELPVHDVGFAGRVFMHLEPELGVRSSVPTTTGSTSVGARRTRIASSRSTHLASIRRSAREAAAVCGFKAVSFTENLTKPGCPRSTRSTGTRSCEEN
jgi:hypothetical protein